MRIKCHRDIKPGNILIAPDCFDKALAIDPRSAGAWNNKSIALEAIGRREEAIGCYDEVPGNMDVTAVDHTVTSFCCTSKGSSEICE